MNHEQQDIKVFFFSIQEGPVMIEVPEDFRAVLAYNDQGAINNVRKEYPAGTPVSVRKRGEVPVKKIMEAINLQTSMPKDMKIHVSSPYAPREKTARDFVYGMMLIADKYVDSARDKASIKRILGKIKINEHEKK